MEKRLPDTRTRGVRESSSEEVTRQRGFALAGSTARENYSLASRVCP